jgi:hypothetical protein
MQHVHGTREPHRVHRAERIAIVVVNDLQYAGAPNHPFQGLGPWVFATGLSEYSAVPMTFRTMGGKARRSSRAEATHWIGLIVGVSIGAIYQI